MKLNKSTIESILRESLKLGHDANIENVSIYNCSNWDSMSHLTLISNLEMQSEIKIQSDDILSLTSFQSILEFFS